MTASSVNLSPAARTTFAAMAGGIALMGLTAFHHAYGAMIYVASFRLHMVLIALPTAFLLAAIGFVALKFEQRPFGRAARIIGALLIFAFPIGMIGFYEGFYNHVVKNAFYFSGLFPAAFATFFPQDVYEAPTNWLFEVSGILQFPIAVMSTQPVWRMLRRGENQA